MEMCEKLHILLKQGRTFNFESDKATMPENGIYILYEKNEKGHGGDRIVRIGTDTGENQLRSRIFQHFIKENKNRSIFRKNIGRALLNKANNPYLTNWNYDTTSKEEKEKYSKYVDKDFERKVEKQISKYMQDNFYFKLIEVNRKDKRLYLEERLIGTVSNCQECQPSKEWLGSYSPIEKIKKSGLWQVQGLFKSGLIEQDFQEIKINLIR